MRLLPLLVALLLVPALAAAGVDELPPATTLAFSGRVVTEWNGGDFRIFVGPFTSFVLTASDSGSGVAATYFRIDDGPVDVYVAPFRLEGASGARDVQWWSVDVAGNEEAPRTRRVLFDADAPPVAITTPERGRTYIYGEMLVSDADGTHAHARDAEATVPAPVLHEARDEPVAYTYIFVRADVGEDSVGVREVRLYDNGKLVAWRTQEPWEFGIDLREDGEHVLRVEAEDRLGNVGADERVVVSKRLLGFGCYDDPDSVTPVILGEGC